MAKVSVDELSKHNTVDDAWLVINGQVWDVTAFAPTHPGGAEIINEYLGGDATNAYNEVHSPSVVGRHLDATKNKGRLDTSTITDEWRARQADKHEAKPAVDDDDYERPPLDAIINLYDFEKAAQRTHSKKTWAFQMTAANDGVTRDANASFYRRIWFRPRVLVGVKDVSTATTILGDKYSVPIFSSPAALAKLSHEDGELALARGLAAKGSTIIACTNASYSFAEIADSLPANHPLFFQLYFNRDRSVTESVVRAASQNPNLKAITVTVDLPVVGKREDDERVKIEASYRATANMQSQRGVIQRDNKGSGLARATGSFIDPDLCWADLRWLQSITHVPIFVKGIQCAADARKALDFGCQGIYISNHGGRAVDTAQPSIVTLLEIQANCPEVLEQMEVFIDGGIRRGTDILKAICLGASAVCLGRPFLYAVGYGKEGVEHAVERKSLPLFPSRVVVLVHSQALIFGVLSATSFTTIAAPLFSQPPVVS
jgi:L-lactate dehydrogenase (cytochrome)